MKIESKTYFSDILKHYRKLRSKDILHDLLLDFLISNVMFFLGFLCVESIWYLSPELKQVIWIVTLFNFVFVYRLIKLFLIPKKYVQDDEDYLNIGSKIPEIQDRLLNHAQLSQLGNSISDLAVEEFIKKYPKDMFFDVYVPLSKVKKYRALLILLSMLMAITLFLPASVERIFHPGLKYNPNYACGLEFSISDTTIYSYDSLNFNISKINAEKLMLELYEKDPKSEDMNLIMRSRDTFIGYSDQRLKSSRQYLAFIRRPHIFYARPYLASDTLNVNVLQRPQIKSLDILVLSPGYSDVPDALYQGNIDKLSCLAGSRISLTLELTEEVGDAFMILDTDSLRMQSQLGSCFIDFIAQKSARISILVKNKDGIQCETNPEYRLEILEDEYPSIYLLTPRKDEEYLLNENMTLPYVAQLQDDYGLSRFVVEYSVHSDYSFSSDVVTDSVELELDKESRYQTRAGIWEIERFVSPGSEIQYVFSLYDNDEIKGPKVTRSQIFYAKLPTLGDLFEANDEKNEENLISMQEEAAALEEIVEDVEMIRKELLQEGKLDWENKSALEENLSMLEEGQKELQELQQAMQEQEKFMKENAMFSDKVMQDFEQLQQMMNELIDDELFNMMQELQEKLKKNDDSNMEKTLEEFSEKAKKFEETLDRMLEIFKRIQQEQRLEELGERIKESLKEQEKILEQTEQRSSEELAEQESKLAQESKDWEKLAEDSADMFSDEAKQSFEEFLDSMMDPSVSEMMQAASQQFSQNNKQSGAEQSQEAKERLKELSEQFSSMSSDMMGEQRKAVEEAFRKAFLQCMYISDRQEKINSIYAGIKENSPLIHAYTSAEYDMLTLALELNKGLLELSKMTFLVDKALGQTLGEVIGYLKSGIQSIEEAKLSTGKNMLSKSFEKMNELGRILLDRMSMVQDQQQGNASGMDFYMQQLQQMAGEQQQMNQGMQQMGMNGSPSQSMMDQMANMAARQQALRRSLKGLQQSMSEDGNAGKRMMGDLDRIAKDMEDVINQMRKNKVNRQTIMRQEKILQRLLDASRSATTRDYKKERESKSGKLIERENPLSLPGNLDEQESLINSIRRELQQSELSPKDKRQMEAYLESLLNESRWKEIGK